MQYEIYINLSDRRKIDGVTYDTKTRELIIGKGCDIISDSEYSFNNLFLLLLNNNNSVYVTHDGKEKVLRYNDIEGIVCNNSQCDCKVLDKTLDNKNCIIEIKVSVNNITKTRLYYTLEGEKKFDMINYKRDTTELRNRCLSISDNDEICQLLGECQNLVIKSIALDKLPDFGGMHHYKKEWIGSIYVLCHASDEEMGKFCKNFSNTAIQFAYNDLCVITSFTGEIVFKNKYRYGVSEIYKIDDNGTIIEHRKAIDNAWRRVATVPIY